MKKAVAIGAISASLLGGAAVGAVLGAPTLVGAQDDPPAGAAPAEEAPEAPGQWVRDALDELVQDGTISTEQADAVATKLAESRPPRPEGGRHGRRGHGRGAGMEAAAAALGMEPVELMQELRDGKTIAQVATARGVEVGTVIDAMVAEASTRLDEAVAEGHLTQEEADEKKAELTERITDVVNNGTPERGPHDHDDEAAPEEEGA